ncbi:ribose-phosphate pyrophosphokinase [Sphingomonas immobilis]|uniref:Ribose-phosphate pyrophosphokinase n=1 Tax=Sphingomonas immobilis TaxID=3063997 RepID=A0ABT9A3F5_9SPHN|nr:ribose-phosphate pyrophosphokinase [Sphingomonas sp. CA1-15]MDO7844376.1 ribose-phosphate pyrophosphokinase [Sphingomonas sp. CA1-15]
MAKASTGFGDTLSGWLEAEGIVPAEGPGTIADVARVRAILIVAAREGRAVSYSELLNALGHRFTRPKMRAVCKTLDAIDEAAAAAGEPELAVLVVRESDRLPGQGWWTAVANSREYKGEWTGADAAAFVASIQQVAFDYWRPA